MLVVSLSCATEITVKKLMFTRGLTLFCKKIALNKLYIASNLTIYSTHF